MDEDAGGADADEQGPHEGTPVDDAPSDETANDDAANDDAREAQGSVAGPFAPDLPIEPEEIDLTNVAFVLLGAYVGMLVVAAIVAPTITAGGRLDALTVGWLTFAFAVVAGLAYAFFARTNAEPPQGNPDT